MDSQVVFDNSRTTRIGFSKSRMCTSMSGAGAVAVERGRAAARGVRSNERQSI